MNQIHDINKRALAFNESIAPQLNNLLKPVFDQFGFTHFAHTRYFDGDRYFMACADTTLAHGFFRNGLDVHMFFQKFPLPLHSKLTVVWDLQKDNDLLGHLRQHGYYHGVTVFYRDERGIQGWNFATSAENSEINQMYVGGIDYISEAIAYIQHATKGLLESIPKDALSVYQDSLSLDIEKTFAQPSEGLNLIKPKKYLFDINGKPVHLTPIEFGCLKSLSEGLTLKVIAHERGLSPRSVESYIENIKGKFQTGSKVHLVKEFHKSFHGCK
jgi:DNA-binding CsgD family transcriptional regulator